MVILNREQVRNLDRIAVERYGIPGLVLMENAGRGATDALLTQLTPTLDTRILVVAGPGNNGGDGFVIARHLKNHGHQVEVITLGPGERFRGPGEAGTNFAIAEKMGLVVSAEDGEALAGMLARQDLGVDAVLGTGLTGEVRGLAREAIEVVNAAGLPVFAVDIPSGLDCDSGAALGTAVRADATATFAAMKSGFEKPGAEEYTGPVVVVDIGCPLVWE